MLPSPKVIRVTPIATVIEWRWVFSKYVRNTAILAYFFLFIIVCLTSCCRSSVENPSDVKDWEWPPPSRTSAYFWTPSYLTILPWIFIIISGCFCFTVITDLEFPASCTNTVIDRLIVTRTVGLLEYFTIHCEWNYFHLFINIMKKIMNFLWKLVM